MSLKLKEKPKNAPSFYSLMEEDFGVALELKIFVSFIKKKV
jgi:hypothetical protein